jgi:uncharacterized membrane protein (TIGR02234 family)
MTETRGESRRPERRRSTFAPVVVLGLASAGGAAYAGSKPWLDTQAPGGECVVVPGFDYSGLALSSPLAAALALVVLASWGVLLVTRGRVRRAVAVLATLASGGYLVTAVEAYWSLKAAARDDAIEQVGTTPQGCQPAGIWMDNVWWPAALVLGVVCIGAALLAVRLVPTWPEMSDKYDAPAGAQADETSEASGDNLDIWKALDEGRDPTA